MKRFFLFYLLLGPLGIALPASDSKVELENQFEALTIDKKIKGKSPSATKASTLQMAYPSPKRHVIESVQAAFRYYQIPIKFRIAKMAPRGPKQIFFIDFSSHIIFINDTCDDIKYSSIEWFSYHIATLVHLTLLNAHRSPHAIRMITCDALRANGHMQAILNETMRLFIWHHPIARFELKSMMTWFKMNNLKLNYYFGDEIFNLVLSHEKNDWYAEYILPVYQTPFFEHVKRLIMFASQLIKID